MIGRATTAAIHVGKKQLVLDDDTYRAMLHSVAGVTSSTQLDEAGADRVLAGIPADGGGSLAVRHAMVREQWARLRKAGWARVAGAVGLAGYAHKPWCTPNSRPVDDFEARHCDKLAAKLGRYVRELKCG